MDFTDLLQLAVYGVVLGSILTLGAVGTSLLFSILRYSNFAHGDIMTFGAYCAFAAVSLIHVPIWLSLVIGIAGGAAASVVIDQLVYRRLRGGHPIIMIIATFGMALVLRSIIILVWGPADRSLVKGVQMPLLLGGLRIRPDHIAIVLATVALVAALHVFLTRTRMGKAMRAMSDDVDLARITGIATEKVIMWTWVLGGGLAGAAGGFLALDNRLSPNMGWGSLLPVFAAAILGGFGRPYGAIVGGMMIGITSELSTAVMSPAYKPAIAFAVMVLMLIVRPEGLLGARR